MDLVNWFSVMKFDAVEALRRLPDKSVDLIITDPAYESLEKHRAKGTTTRLKVSKSSSNAWFNIFPNNRYPEFFVEMKRVLKKDRHLYVFCDLDTAKIIDPIGQAAGFTLWNWIVWRKPRIGMGYHYRRRKEFILFFEKGKRRLKNLGEADVLDAIDPEESFYLTDEVLDSSGRATGRDSCTCPADEVIVPEYVRDTDSFVCKKCQKGLAPYPTEKPVDLIEKFVSNSSNAGEILCDPFMGSGSSGAAGAKHKLHFIGNDISEDSLARVVPRLKTGYGMAHVSVPQFTNVSPQSRLI